MKTILTPRGFSVPDKSFDAIQDWCSKENITNTKVQRDIEDEFNKIGVVKRWTPVLTFATPGNLAVSYTTAVADYIRMREWVTANFRIITSAFTWTTSSGNLQITGLPYTASSSSNDTNYVWQGGGLVFGGVTKASYTQFVPQVSAGSNVILIAASGSGQAPANLVAADLPSGGSVVLSGSVSFRLKP